MITFQGECNKLYYTQHTLLSNVGQIPILLFFSFFFFFFEKQTHTREMIKDSNIKAHNNMLHA